MNAMDRFPALTLPGERPEVRQFALRVVSQVARGTLQANARIHQKLVDLITRFALSGDARALGMIQAEMTELRVSGFQIIDEYFPIVIGRIGTDWHEARINVLDATVATCRLQSVLREFARATVADQSCVCLNGCVLLIMPPGEQHCLGAMIAANQLRRKGVSVRLMLNPMLDDVRAVLARTSFDGVFLSATNSDAIEEIITLVDLCRAEVGGDLPIVLGGGLVSRLQCDTERDALRLQTGVNLVTQSLEAALDVCKLDATGVVARASLVANRA